jgi:hypothetical protein
MPLVWHCTIFSITLSVHSIMFACNLKSGEGHAFLLLDDLRVMDNRFDEVVPYGEVGAGAALR